MSSAFNDLPFDQRRRLQPDLIEMRINYLKQARAIMVRGHNSALAEFDARISECRKSLANAEKDAAVPNWNDNGH